MSKIGKLDYIYKILILGESTVGKTSLLIRSLDNKFENGVPTLGVDIRYKYLKYENKNIKLDLWDTAGQERFKAIISTYYKGAHAAIFVFDITNADSFEKMKALIESTRADAFDLKMIIVENKVDLEDERKVKEEAIEEYQQASNIDVIKASSKTGEGIEQAFLSLIKELQKDKKFNEIRKMIHKIKIDNWKKFLEELVKLKVSNNVKEYFLRMKFYTDIGRNVSILNNLKIKKNGKIIITINKKEINNEVKNKYKELFGDKGIKNNYINPNNNNNLTITKKEYIKWGES